MSLQETLATLSTDLLVKYGEEVTFTRELDNIYDPDTGTVIKDTDTYTANAYPSRYTAFEIDGTTIKQEDTRLIVDSPNEPDVNDTVLLNGSNYRILNKQQISVSGGNVLYILQVRY